MKKLDLAKKFVRKNAAKIAGASKKNAPVILTVAAIVGVGATAYSAVKAKEKHDKVVEEFTPETTTKEKVVKLAPVWAPTALIGLTTAGCMGASTKISADRIATLTTALAMSEKNFDIWKEKIQETTPEEEYSKYQEAVAQEYVNQNPFSKSSNIFHTGHGNEIFHDHERGIYFYSDKSFIKDIVADLNIRLNDSNYMFGEEIDLNELYSRLGIGECNFGCIHGWHEGDIIKLALVPAQTDDGQLCWDLDYNYGLI